MAIPFTNDVLPLVFTGIEAGGIVLLEPDGTTGGFSDCAEELAADEEMTGGLEELTIVEAADDETLIEEITGLVLLKELVFEETMTDDPIPDGPRSKELLSDGSELSIVLISGRELFDELLEEVLPREEITVPGTFCTSLFLGISSTAAPIAANIVTTEHM